MAIEERLQDYAERRSLRTEIRALAKEERKRQQKAMDEVLSQAPVICATLTGVLGRQVDNLSFDVSVVDEAAQVCPSSPSSHSAMMHFHGQH